MILCTTANEGSYKHQLSFEVCYTCPYVISLKTQESVHVYKNSIDIHVNGCSIKALIIYVAFDFFKWLFLMLM